MSPHSLFSPFALNQPITGGLRHGGRDRRVGVCRRGTSFPQSHPGFLHGKVGLNPEVKAKLKVKSLLTFGALLRVVAVGVVPVPPPPPRFPRGLRAKLGPHRRGKLLRCPRLRMEQDPRTGCRFPSWFVSLHLIFALTSSPPKSRRRIRSPKCGPAELRRCDFIPGWQPGGLCPLAFPFPSRRSAWV